MILSAPSSRFPRLSATGGFSLIEVVMAIGIMSFCLVGMVGLLAVGIDLGRVSKATTTNAMIFEKVVNQLRIASIDTANPTTGEVKTDRYELPALNTAGNETTFTVDSQNRFLQSGATKSGDASKVVRVTVLDPSDAAASNMDSTQTLSSGGQIAFVRVEIKSAQGYEKDSNSPLSVPSVFSTEINLLAQ